MQAESQAFEERARPGVDMRCDRCPAEAKVRYVKDGEQPWQWCRDHDRVYDAGLTSTGWRRFALVKAPA